MPDRREFIVTDDHLKLLAAMYVGWDDCEFGAPAIDCKRPYGNSSVVLDMCEILGVSVDDDDGPTREDDERMTALHREMQTVLQILVGNLAIQTGRYTAERYGSRWTLAKPADSGRTTGAS
jgi:hypothetical protein